MHCVTKFIISCVIIGLGNVTVATAGRASEVLSFEQISAYIQTKYAEVAKEFCPVGGFYAETHAMLDVDSIGNVTIQNIREYSGGSRQTGTITFNIFSLLPTSFIVKERTREPHCPEVVTSFVVSAKCKSQGCIRENYMIEPSGVQPYPADGYPKSVSRLMLFVDQTSVDGVSDLEREANRLKNAFRRLAEFNRPAALSDTLFD